MKSAKMLAASLLMILAPSLPALGLDLENATGSVTAPAMSIDIQMPDLGDSQPIVCTPEDGNDYWAEYCISWEVGPETVTTVDGVGGPDQICIVYPVPCAPDVVEPIDTSTRTMTLARIMYTAHVDSAQICEDLGGCPDPCSYPYYFACIQIKQSVIAGPDIPDQVPFALADSNGNGRYDGVAVLGPSGWAYVPGDCILEPCYYPATTTTEASTVVFQPSTTVCTPSGQAYWIDHCEAFTAEAGTVHSLSLSTDRDEACIIYPVPCVPTFTAQVDAVGREATLYRYQSAGGTDTGEVAHDLLRSVIGTCNNAGELMPPSWQFSCEIRWAASLVTPDFPDAFWQSVTHTALVDTGSDGLANGVAFRVSTQDSSVWTDINWIYLQAEEAAGDIHIQYPQPVETKWIYVPFPMCMQVDPEHPMQSTISTVCRFDSIDL